MTAPSHKLPTELLYQKPDFAKYELAKTAYIAQQFGPAYTAEGVTTETKWDLLMAAFKASVPEEYQTLFTDFTESRKQVNNNSRFILSLSDNLTFFEHFYFLYTGNNNQFCLHEMTKPEFLTDIQRGMGGLKKEQVCETGVTTDFNTYLRKYRRDLNWIAVELHQQRAQIIERIAEEYNAKNHVYNSLSIHTIKYVFRLAEAKKLGVAQDIDIEDVHLNFINTSEIERYFEAVYPIYFAEYEQSVLNNLLNHVVFQFRTTFLKGMVLTDWDNEEVSIKNEVMINLFPKYTEFLELYFLPNTPDNDFPEEEQGYDYRVIKQTELSAKYRTYIAQKLEHEGYFVSLETLTEDNADQLKLRLPEGLTGKALWELKRDLTAAVTAPEKFKLLVANNLNYLRKLPVLLVDNLITNPKIWYALPKTLQQDLVVIDALILELDNQLAYLDEQASLDKAQPAIDLLLKLIHSNPDILQAGSYKFLSNKNIALKLINQQGMLYKFVTTNLQIDPEICQSAINQNPQVVDYLPKYRASVLDVYFQALNKEIFDIHLQWDKNNPATLEKAKHALELLTAKTVPPMKLAELAQCLTPLELLRIAHLRKGMGRSDFIGCDTDSLAQFIFALNLKDLTWDRGYIQFKRDRLQQAQPIDKGSILATAHQEWLAQQCIINNNQWFLAFLSFQNQNPSYYSPFRGLQDVLHQLHITAAIGLSLLKTLLRVVLQTIQFAITLGLALAFFWVKDAFAAFAAELAAHMISTYSILFAIPLHVYAMVNLMMLILDESPSLGATLFILLVFALFLSPSSFIQIAIELELMYGIYYLAANVFIGCSLLLGSAWSMSELNHIFITTLQFYLTAELRFGVALLGPLIIVSQALFIDFPSHLFALVIPWISRSIETIKTLGQRLESDDLLKIKVEESILRLVQDTAIDAQIKGNAMAGLWEKIQLDVTASGGSLSYQQGLNRKYSIFLEGQECQTSFMELAAVHRTGTASLDLKNTQSPYAFFAYKPKTTTEQYLHDYAAPALSAVS